MQPLLVLAVHDCQNQQSNNNNNNAGFGYGPVLNLDNRGHTASFAKRETRDIRTISNLLSTASFVDQFSETQNS